ncbi:MAG: CocE/NonD family hydrolase, partial [Actinomycetota bacterium]|nr:CocE/NonD family hydrolase [Actinomycetota bacterium]
MERKVGIAALVALMSVALIGGSFASPAGAKKKKKAPPITAVAKYKARGSVGDAYVTGAKKGTKLLLVNRKNRIIRRGKADRYGSKIFYDVKPGPGYTVRTRKGKRRSQGTKRFRILKAGANPNPSFYRNKPLREGLNFVKMRDGVELAMTVRLPQGKSMANGPFPTFIEYSGYQTAAPHDLFESIIGGVAGASDPLAPATSTAVGALIGPMLDMAVVSVQMRGSGCSGGAFDLFGWPTTYDGYDAVEMVAAQDWVKGKVGMGGISFSGITQLFTAGTQPPSLAAITPMSVTDDIYSGTGFPGGIFNKGFAYTWITERMADAKPAPDGGQEWSRVMSTTGDPAVTDPVLREQQKQHCLDNQKMRLQTRDANKLIEQNPFRTPKLFEKRSPGKWLGKTKVPVFLIGQFQDEQTGGHFPEALAGLKNNPKVWLSLQNGVHVDSLGPSTITRWIEFLKLYVADEVPVVPPLILALGPALYQQIADSAALPILPSRFTLYPSAKAARAQFEKDPRLRLLMDNGDAIPGVPGSIGAKWEAGFSDWPVPSMKPTTWFLGTQGQLQAGKPAKGTASYLSDPAARPLATLPDANESDSWKPQPPYDWQPVKDGKGLAWISPAMSEDTFIAGPSSVDLYLKSSHRNTDIQVTLTEVRPDGKETYIQNGWLRATHRALDPEQSTAYNPVQTWLKQDARPLK